MGAAVTRGASEVPDTSMLPLLRCTLSANTAHSRVAAVLVDSLRARGVLVLNPATERDTCSGRSKLRRITGFLHWGTVSMKERHCFWPQMHRWAASGHLPIRLPSYLRLSHLWAAWSFVNLDYCQRIPSWVLVHCSCPLHLLLAVSSEYYYSLLISLLSNCFWRSLYSSSMYFLFRNLKLNLKIYNK